MVLAVDGDPVFVEPVDKVVAAGLEEVAAEHAGGAVQMAGVGAEQGLEVVTLVQELHARGRLVIAFQAVVRAAAGVFHPVVTTLVQHRGTRGPALAQRTAHGTFQVHHVVAAVAELGVALEILRRAHRIELDHAGRGVAAEQRALRAAQHFHLVHVVDRVGLQHHVFQHHVVLDDRHGLRGTQVEVDVAQAADVEAREGTAEGRFDVQAGHAAGQEAHVGAAGAERVELFAADGADRDRHVLDVLALACGGDADRVQGGSLLGGAFLRHRHGRQQGRQGDNERTHDRGADVGRAG